jgi:hypothetical protein
VSLRPGTKSSAQEQTESLQVEFAMCEQLAVVLQGEPSPGTWKKKISTHYIFSAWNAV